MKNNLDNFDKSIKNAVDQFQIDEDEKLWDELSLELNKVLPKETLAFTPIFTGLFSTIIIATSIFLLTHENKNSKAQNQLELVNKEASKLAIKSETKNEHLNKEVRIENSTKIKELKPSSTNSEVDLKPLSEEEKNNPVKINITNKSTIELVDTILNQIKIPSTENLLIVTNKDSYCVGEEIEITTNSSDVKTWNFGDGYVSTEKAPIHTYEISGQYTIELETYENKKLTKSVLIYPKEDIDFTIQEPESNDLNQEYEFTSYIQENNSTIWKLNNEIIGKAVPKVNLPLYRQNENILTLSHKNEFGCESKISKSFHTEEYKLNAANTLSLSTPIGWMPLALKETNSTFDLKIQDRYGNIVFQTNSSSEKWRGTYPDNKPVKPMEVYAWKVYFINKFGNPVTLQGAITVIN